MIILIMVVAITVIEDDVNERNDVNNNDGGDYGTEENIDHETVGDGTDGAKDYNVSRDVGGGNDGDWDGTKEYNVSRDVGDDSCVD